jgi:hypothetical protein
MTPATVRCVIAASAVIALSGPCDLNFNVTAIQQDARCTAAAEPPGPGEQFLRIDIEAFSSYPTFDFQGSEDALLLQNWSVDGADGASFHDLTYYSECSTGAVPISNRLAAGEQAHATVVVCGLRNPQRR